MAAQKPARSTRDLLSGSIELSPHAWQAACLLILLVAAILRLYSLSLKPLHHDEGVNGYFLERLFRQGIYQYDPANYHGPTLYYFALLVSSFTELFSSPNEVNTASIRLVPALFGIATVGLLFCLRRRLGNVGALAASVLVAVSPGAVYLARDFIHETLLVFFTLGVVVAMIRYQETSQPRYLMLASASTALMFVTKETAAISVVALLLAMGCTFIYFRTWEPGNGAQALIADHKPLAAARKSFAHTAALWIVAVMIVVAIYVLFYSSFLSDPKGIHKGIEAFRYWIQTGSKEHRAPWYTYVRWFAQAEPIIFALGLVGTILAMWHRRERFPVFAGLWGFGLLAAYSLLAYKTPWLMLNFLVPLAISAGYAVQAGWEWAQNRESKRAFALSLVVGSFMLATILYQSISLNFFRYDNPRIPYVYSQTRREALQLVEEINAVAARSGSGKETTIMVTSREYWPLPWYLRDYRFTGYSGRIVEPKEMVVIASATQEEQLRDLLHNNYRRVGEYPLRPAVTLVLYVRKTRYN